MNTPRLAHPSLSFLFIALFGFAATASADDHEHHGHHGRGHAYGHYKHHGHDYDDDDEVHYHYYTQPAPVIHRHYYQSAPQPYYPARNSGYGDYGVRSGRCDNHTVAQVLGGVAGGALGGALGSGMSNGNGVGTVVGAVAGTVLGAVIGDRVGAVMDPNDRFCAGRALDYAQDRHRVDWYNPQSQVGYQLMPLRSFHQDGVLCREFTTSAGVYGDGRQIACRLPNGDWDIRS